MNPMINGRVNEDNPYLEARKKYVPDRIECLLIAESPPPTRGYFYFEDFPVEGLFESTMCALYPDRLHEAKKKLLESFSEEGIYLLDAVLDTPLHQRAQVEVSTLGNKKRWREELQRIETKLPPQIRVIPIGNTAKKDFFPLLAGLLKVVGFERQIQKVIELPFPTPRWPGSIEKYKDGLCSILRP